MTAHAYLRVSTALQAESGLGLDAQRSAIERYCRSNNIEDVRWFCDEGVSGAATLANRPELVKALSICKGDVLIVAKRDRLARDVMMAGYIEDTVRRKGGRIVSVAGKGTDDNSPTGKLMRQILDAFSEFERDLIAARTKAAKAQQKAKGEFCGGSPPYGFRSENGSLVPDEGERQAIDRARSLRESGLAWREVSERLESEGFKPRRAKRWHISQLRRVCEATTCSG